MKKKDFIYLLLLIGISILVIIVLLYNLKKEDNLEIPRVNIAPIPRIIKEANLELEEKIKSVEAILKRLLKSETRDEVGLERMKRHKTFLENLLKSNYAVIKGRVVREPRRIPLSPAEEEEMKIINKAFEAIRDTISVPEGAKVLIQLEKDRYIVIFDNRLPEGVFGGDYSAKVTIDAKSGEILEILGSY